MNYVVYIVTMFILQFDRVVNMSFPIQLQSAPISERVTTSLWQLHVAWLQSGWAGPRRTLIALDGENACSDHRGRRCARSAVAAN